MENTTSINIKGSFDASGIKSGAASAVEAFEKINEPLERSKKLIEETSITSTKINPKPSDYGSSGQFEEVGKQAENQKLKEGIKDFSDNQKDTTEAIKENTTLLRDVLNKQNGENSLKDAKTSLADFEKNKDSDKDKEDLEKKITGNLDRSINATGTTASNMARNLQNGDTFATATSALSGAGSLLKMIGGALGPVGIGLSALGLGGALVNQVAQQYEQKIPEIISLNGLYGNKSTRDSTNEQNERRLMINNKRNSDNLIYSTADYAEIMQGLSRYGYSSDSQALNSASNILKYQQGTSADRQSLLNFQGLAVKYGGETTAIENAYKGLKASNLSTGEFSSFLEGLKSVMEEGISKGFVKSSKEISTDLSMLAKLSNNNPLWTGQQGMERMKQIGRGMENSTALNSATDILINKSMGNVLEGNNGTTIKNKLKFNGVTPEGEIANFMLAERGMSIDTLPEIAKNVNQVYGGSNFERISAYKNMFGLNYTSAFQLDSMMSNFLDSNGNIKPGMQEELKKQLNSFKSDVKNQSKESQYLSNVESIKTTTENISKAAWGVKADTTEILAELIGGNSDRKEFNKLQSLTALRLNETEYLQAYSAKIGSVEGGNNPFAKNKILGDPIYKYHDYREIIENLSYSYDDESIKESVGKIIEAIEKFEIESTNVSIEGAKQARDNLIALYQAISEAQADPNIIAKIATDFTVNINNLTTSKITGSTQ